MPGEFDKYGESYAGREEEEESRPCRQLIVKRMTLTGVRTGRA
jgi:hypothetical protein